MKLCLSFWRLEVNNNNINPTNLSSKAEPEGAEQHYYWWTLIMCCAWQTHLGQRKTFKNSSNRNLQIQQLLSGLVQGFREPDHRVFVAEGTWVSLLWFGDWEHAFAMWIFELADLSSVWLIIRLKMDASVSTSPPDTQKKCHTANYLFQEELLWNADSLWVMLIKSRLVASQQIQSQTQSHLHMYAHILIWL